MDMKKIAEFSSKQQSVCVKNDTIDDALFEKYGVNRGLRDINGKGVLTGLTRISKIVSFTSGPDGKQVPCPGELWYRGYNIKTLIKELGENEFGFEKTAYLLLFGEKPTESQLIEFQDILDESRSLPTNFTRDVIMKAPSKDIMNSITRSVLTLASYDESSTDSQLENSIKQCIQLIAQYPMLSVYSYHAYNHYDNDESMYIHRPRKGRSTAENFLAMLRPDQKYTALEAKVLDVALMLHMEHGGGNNSTFTTRVVTSSGSDTYSAMAAAMSSLKGPKHGGANIKVVEMMDDLKEHVDNWEDRVAIKEYLMKILKKDAFDRSGLIYGMGHAVYSMSDPREEVLNSFVEKLAKEKDMERDYILYKNVEELAPEAIAETRRIFKGVSPNVDFYSGLVYKMLNIPPELYTPLFATARIVGWSSHRIEELIGMNKIIRPAYKSVMEEIE
ncbi:MAG TPA: citrate synthase [Clostridiales bacterium]|nr:citrate synthase [Clostridiales bacterium]HBZ77957.1 citrate synthase [Clostridiales bacterium]